MKEAYWGWYKLQGGKVEIEMKNWGMQKPESLMYLIRKLELDK